MSAKGHYVAAAIYGLLMAIVAIYASHTGSMFNVGAALLLAIFSAEHRILAEIKVKREDE